jgi:hypothetical protein
MLDSAGVFDFGYWYCVSRYTNQLGCTEKHTFGF